jgi:hypothetical protein
MKRAPKSKPLADDGYLRPALVTEIPAPTREEARRRIRSRPGFLRSLSPEALAAILAGEGPDYIGPPPPQNRRKQPAE